MEPVYPTTPPVADAPGPSGPSAPLPPPLLDLPPPPPPAALASPWLRAEGALVEAVLFVCTLGLGWIVWWIVAWARGDTPAKQVLAVRIVRTGDRQLASFGVMAAREALGKMVPLVLGLASLYLSRDGVTGTGFIVGFVAAYFVCGFLLMFVDEQRQTPWDKLADTVAIAPRPTPSAPLSPPLTPPEASTALP